MDIKIIISMFEDLKKLISEQFNNLSKLVESLANAKSNQPALPIIPQQVDLSELENHAAQTNELIKEGVKKHQELLDELGQKLQQQQDKPLPIQKHLHIIELKSSKVIIALVSLGILLLSSLIYNLWQLSENNRLNDNDIKFRYIKVMGEISTENLLKLEMIFEYEPDRQKQHSLRKMVEDHEQRVKQRTKELEQARLKEMQAEQLRKEAESVKQKKWRVNHLKRWRKQKFSIFSLLYSGIFHIFIAKKRKHQYLIDMNRIKEVLEEKGIKQTWLAEKIGKSFSQTNAYVCNRRQPSLEQLFEIAKILDVDVKDLIESNKKQ